MKTIKEVLVNTNYELVRGSLDKEVKRISFDSRDVRPGDLFVAIVGSKLDGHDYIASALENGCTSFVLENKRELERDDLTIIQVNDSSEALSQLSNEFFDHPSEKLTLVGITGTNGKTTTATLLHELYTKLGNTCGLVSTVVNKIGSQSIQSTHTTPNPFTLNSLLNDMVDKGCSHCFMEVSSHAVVQNRILGLHFKGAVFTNISHDHLDYHKTFSAYINAKKSFFDGLTKDAFALVNTDDKNGLVMLQNTRAQKYHYALSRGADFKAKIIENELSGLVLQMEGTEFYSRLIGKFNAYNLLTVFATAVLLGEDRLETLSALSEVKSVDGRFQYLKGENGPTAIVDYAHTPDALENVLSTINSIKKNKARLFTVVGCGGDRDTAKRPLMASIAAKWSDQLILTSDNPRSEDPNDILDDMKKGLDKSEQDMAISVTDRKEAIKLAIKLAGKKDIVLLAGKGHEKYQEIKGVKYDFDDYKIASELLNEIQN